MFKLSSVKRKQEENVNFFKKQSIFEEDSVCASTSRESINTTNKNIFVENWLADCTSSMHSKPFMPDENFMRPSLSTKDTDSFSQPKDYQESGNLLKDEPTHPAYRKEKMEAKTGHSVIQDFKEINKDCDDDPIYPEIRLEEDASDLSFDIDNSPADEIMQMGVAADLMVSIKKSTVKKDQRKYLRQSGQEYTRRDGSICPKREFVFKECKCNFHCGKRLPEDVRREIFAEFWNLGSWDAQSAFICSTASPIPVKRHNHTPQELQKSMSVAYILNSIRICKAVYCSTLGITKSRVGYAINNKQVEGIASPDKRGKKTPPNKLPAQTSALIANFLEPFPKFKCRYSDNPKFYLSADLTFKRLHSLYLERHPKNPVSTFIFKRELTNNNVTTYIPKKDTCNECDECKMKMQTTFNGEETDP